MPCLELDLKFWVRRQASTGCLLVFNQPPVGMGSVPGGVLNFLEKRPNARTTSIAFAAALVIAMPPLVVRKKWQTRVGRLLVSTQPSMKDGWSVL